MENLTIKNISETTKKVLCNHKLYKELDFFQVPHNKVCLAVIRELTKLSYNEIGKAYKKSWFTIYSAVKDTNKNGLKSFTAKVIDLVKAEVK
jgi:hypothetical protein